MNPSEEQLSQIDQPAEDNTWHEKPDFSNVKQQIRDRVPSKEQAKQEAKEAAGDVSQSAHPQGVRDPASPDAPSIDRQQAAAESTDPNQSARQGGQVGKEHAKSKIGGRFTEDEKQRMREYRERTNNYFKEKVPKERRDQLIFRLKKMVVEVQTHQDCRCSVRRPLTLRTNVVGRSASNRHAAPPGRGGGRGSRRGVAAARIWASKATELRKVPMIRVRSRKLRLT